MGSTSNIDYSQWRSYKSANQNKVSSGATSQQIFRQGDADSKYIVRGKVRESRDNDVLKNSGAIIIGLDTTGSMSSVLESVYKGLELCTEEIFKRIKTFDPQIMFAAIDDYDSMLWHGEDECPALQVTQFENDIRIVEQLTDLKETGCGAGNGKESYPLLWYFASRKTSIDCWEKRHKKGVIITMGDDGLQKHIDASEFRDVFGDTDVKDMSTSDLYREVSKKYDVYHLILEEGSECRYGFDRVYKSWQNVLGERALRVNDIKKLPEIIVSVIQMAAGANAQDVVDSWDGSAKLAVAHTLNGLSTVKEETGVWRP